MNDLSAIIRSLAECEGNWTDAAGLVRRRLPGRIKGAIGASDHADLSDGLASMAGGLFLESLQHGPSVFDLLRPYARRAQFRTPLFLGSGVTASVAGEGISIPVAKFSVDSAGLVPKKAAALAIATNEALKTEEGSEAAILELKLAVALATDTEFLSTIVSEADSTTAATNEADLDIRGLLDAVNLTGYGQLFLIVGPTTANVLATYTNTAGVPLYPDATPTGGQLHGVQMLVTGALTDSAILLDANALVLGASEMELKLSQSASIEMETAPTMNSETPAAATGHLASLFQTNCSGLLGIRSFAGKLLRPTGAAVLTGVNWAGESS